VGAKVRQPTDGIIEPAAKVGVRKFAEVQKHFTQRRQAAKDAKKKRNCPLRPLRLGAFARDFLFLTALKALGKNQS
jgi:hypothetical protein